MSAAERDGAASGGVASRSGSAVVRESGAAWIGATPG